MTSVLTSSPFIAANAYYEVQRRVADPRVGEARVSAAAQRPQTGTDQSLQAEWKWKFTKPYTGERHDYRLNIHLVNTATSIVNSWRAEVWFPSQFIDDLRGNGPFVYFDVDDSKYSESGKRIWPDGRLRVHQIDYFVNGNNWPGWDERERAMPVVRIRVSAAGQRAWEMTIPFMKLQNF